jgi:hypothetical protein
METTGQPPARVSYDQDSELALDSPTIRGHVARIVPHEHHIIRRDRDVGSRPDRDSDIGR